MFDSRVDPALSCRLGGRATHHQSGRGRVVESGERLTRVVGVAVAYWSNLPGPLGQVVICHAQPFVGDSASSLGPADHASRAVTGPQVHGLRSGRMTSSRPSPGRPGAE